MDNNKTLSELVKNNMLNMDMITIVNYIEHTITMITDQPSIISKNIRILAGLYLFGDMPTHEIAEKMCMRPADVASKASQLNKAEQITKHGIFFSLTKESRNEVLDLENTIKKNAAKLSNDDFILLYNSYVSFVAPFADLDERPSLLYLVMLVVGVYEKICWDLFKGRREYNRVSILYYTEMFDIMDYVKLSHILAKSIQNIQILAKKLDENGYIKIDQQKIRQQRPDITITQNGYSKLIDSINEANKGISAMMLSMESGYREDFVNSLNGIKYIATKIIKSGGFDKEF